MIRNITLLAFSFAALFAFGQTPERDCAAHAITKQYLLDNGLSPDIQAALPHVSSVERGGNYTVPVVVHIVYNTTAENVSNASVMSIINELNQDYTQTNSNIGTVRPGFTSVIGNVGFNFCLAQVDPSGNPTTGITRTQTSQTWFDPDTETNLMKEAQYGKTPWTPSQYLNIWVCDITSGATGGFITVGYAYLPVGGVVGSSIDGLVIDYSYGLSVGDRTATHEIGHYFGLGHTFDDNGGCGNSDGFTDTPNSNSPTYSCSNTTLMKCGVLTQYENFMDYSNCTAMFTQQQSNYMAGILTGVRSGLLNTNVCGTVTPGYCTPTSTNGTADGDFINGVQLGSINNANSGGTTAPTYTNFSSTYSTTLTQGTAYTLTVQGGTYQPDHYAAWIDYDHDQTFEAAEKVGEVISSSAAQTMTFSFTVPSGATTGATRLRVRGVYHNTGEPTPDTDPCFAYGYGETEDYGITINSGTAGGYCIPTSSFGTADGDFINSVQLGSINNTGSGGITAPAYSNLTGQFSTSVARNTQYTITIQSGTYQPDAYAAWIDYNGDQVFGASEKLGEFNTTAISETQTIVFTVPNSATLGATRLRVRGVYLDTGEPTPADPCFAYAYGETEDYTVVVSTSTGIDEFDEETVAIYPNPAGEQVTVVLASDRPATIHLIDPQGRMVMEERMNTSMNTMDLSGVATGTYMMRVLQDDQVFVRRLEVQHGRP